MHLYLSCEIFIIQLSTVEDKTTLSKRRAPITQPFSATF